MGYVFLFEGDAEFLARYSVKTVGGSSLQEYWIPCEQLDEFNAAIVGLIEKIGEYRGEALP